MLSTNDVSSLYIVTIYRNWEPIFVLIIKCIRRYQLSIILIEHRDFVTDFFLRMLYTIHILSLMILDLCYFIFKFDAIYCIISTMIAIVVGSHTLAVVINGCNFLLFKYVFFASFLYLSQCNMFVIESINFHNIINWNVFSNYSLRSSTDCLLCIYVKGFHH